MVRPGALRPPRNYPRRFFVFMVILLHFMRPVQTAGGRRWYSWFRTVQRRTSKDSVRRQVRITNESVAGASAEHGCAFSLFFFFFFSKEGRSLCALQ